jgi:urease accessory protein
MTAADLALLLLADGRFPAGGHVHSAGIESAVADRRVTGLASLEDFVVGRLWTVALTDAALVAATAVRLLRSNPPSGARTGGLSTSSRPRTDGGAQKAVDVIDVIDELDAEAAARIPVPVLREASRRQGRQLVRVAGRCWPSPVLAAIAADRPDGVHLPVALGAVAGAAGLTPTDAARLSVHHALATPTQGALRLLGLDPFAVAALTARLAGPADAVVAAAVAAATGPVADLPARTGPLTEIAAHEHRRWDIRLFAT